MEKLEQWYKQISNLKKLNFNEAKQLTIKLNNTKDQKQKKEYMDELILGTLYVVYNHLKSNYFELLLDSSYDMDDIINTFNELWIKALKENKLLKVSCFSYIFRHDFYNELTKILIRKKYKIGEETYANTETFKHFFSKYLEMKNKNNNIKLDEFIEIKECNKDDYWNYLEKYQKEQLFILFEQIYNHMNFDKTEDCNIAISRFDFLKYLFINSTLTQNLTKDQKDNTNYEDKIVNSIYINEVMEIIEDSLLLDDKKKNILYLRFGIYGNKKTLNEIAMKYGVAVENIRQKEEKILRKLKHDKKLKDYIK